MTSLKAVSTARFGTVSVEEHDILHFDQGIPGFFDLREWFLVGEDDNPLKWLQSVDDGAVALPVTIPQGVCSDYHAHLAEGDLEGLDSSDPEDLGMLVVVTIPPEAPWEITANLRAPIVVNQKTRQAKQVVALNEEYSLRTYLFPEELRRSMAAQSSSAEFSMGER